MDNAQFISFSSSHDLNRVPAGESFVANWRVRNTGTTTWGAGYKVVHIHAESGSTLMTNQASFELAEVAAPAVVAPGQETDITLTMTAPAPRDRRYFTDWQLQNPQGRRFGEIIWLRVVTVTPPAGPGGFLKSDSKFVEDLSIADGTPLEAGTPFLKQWVVGNSGQRKWNQAYRLVFVGGDTVLTGSFSHPVPEASPGEEVVISVEMVAPPARIDPYVSNWRIHDDRNIPFGDILWVKIFSTHKEVGFSVTAYSQNDPRWKLQLVGRGNQTFSQFGCLIACYAMMLSRFGEMIDPLALNNRLLQLPPNQGFNGSDVFFVAPAAAFDHVNYLGNFKPRPETGATFAQFRADLISLIDQGLARDEGVIVQVDTDPTDAYNMAVEQHWVYVLARQGNDYLVIDPIDGGSVSLLSKYGQQSRPQSPEEALKDAIKSALFYRSTRLPGAPVVSDGDTGGASDIGATVPLVYTGPAWPFGRCLRGVHDRANRHPQPADHALVRGRFESVKVMSGITVAEMKAYEARFYLCRLFESFNGRHIPISEFVRAVIPDMTPLVEAGVEYFEFHNEPNLTHEGLNAQGIVGSWSSGAEFAQYFIEGRQRLKQQFPNIKVGFPGLSPGPSTEYQFGHDRGFRLSDSTFLEGAVSAIQAADFIGVHAYYLSMEEVRNQAIDLVKSYRRRWPDKLLFVTEFSNPDPAGNVAAIEKGRQARAFYELCNQIPGVGAAYYFVVSGTGWDRQALRREGEGQSTGILEGIFS